MANLPKRLRNMSRDMSEHQFYLGFIVIHVK